MFILSNCNIEKLIDYIQTNKNMKLNYIDNLENYIKNINNIREYYLNATVIDPSSIDLKIYKPNENNIYDLLSQNGFNNDYIIKNIQKYKNYFNKILLR
jgi:hypothetical protein